MDEQIAGATEIGPMDMSILLGPVDRTPESTSELPCPQRNFQIKDRYLAGETLGNIGQVFGLSAERVRKIVKKFGLTKRNAGLAVRNLNKPRLAQKQPYILRVYGCDAAQLQSFRPEQRQAFLQHRTNIRRAGDIAWELTLPQWTDIWTRSGKWEERGQGPLKYGLVRIDIAGSFSVGNVGVTRNHESAMRGRKLKSAASRREAHGKGGNRDWVREMARILKKSSRVDVPGAEAADRQ